MPTKGKFIEGSSWTRRQDFEFDYRYRVEKREAVICPGCDAIITCDLMMGIGDSRSGWCDTCKKAVEGTPAL
jgi:hypothetical protein